MGGIKFAEENGTDVQGFVRAAGITTYVPDIRGHGGSGRRGDIDYIGQLDDDLADLVAQLGPAKNGETRSLVGFSAGAGFTIRFAGGPYRPLFDRYVFLSPILPGAPTLRPSAGGWTNISLPGIVTIASLDRLGIHWFDAFPVISYAVSPEMSRETYLRNVCRPAIVLLEDADEQVVAGEFAPLMQRLGVDIPVTLVPNMKHADVIATPEALQALVGAIIAPK